MLSIKLNQMILTMVRKIGGHEGLVYTSCIKYTELWNKYKFK